MGLMQKELTKKWAYLKILFVIGGRGSVILPKHVKKIGNDSIDRLMHRTGSHEVESSDFSPRLSKDP